MTKNEISFNYSFFLDTKLSKFFYKPRMKIEYFFKNGLCCVFSSLKVVDVNVMYCLKRQILQDENQFFNEFFLFYLFCSMW